MLDQAQGGVLMARTLMSVEAALKWFDANVALDANHFMDGLPANRRVIREAIVEGRIACEWVDVSPIVSMHWAAEGGSD